MTVRDERAHGLGRGLSALIPQRHEGRSGPIETVVRQLEGAPVDGERARDSQLLVQAHRLRWVDVLRTHEPARLVGADRQRREIG